MVLLRSRCTLLLRVMPALLGLLLPALGAQAFPSFSGQSPSPVPSQLITPFNPFGTPRPTYVPAGSDVVPLSSAMLSGILPRIPNLEVGFLYNFGNQVRSGRLYADYLLPLSLSADSLLFGEAHYENQDFWKRPSGGANYRQDLSLGGGFRRVFSDSSFFGINAFCDSTKLYGKWYWSCGIGLEMVALTPGDGAIDLNFNWYGNLINRSELINAFRNKSGSWDIEAGVSQPLFDQALDLRLNARAYQFNIGTAIYGYRIGAELTTRSGFFTLKYEFGRDKVNGAYNTVGGYVNVGFQLENLARGYSPFSAPEPVFGSPRNLRRLLSQKVRRNWHQPEAVAMGARTERELVPFRTISDGGRIVIGQQVLYVGTTPVTPEELQEAKRITIILTTLINESGSGSGSFIFGLYAGPTPPGAVISPQRIFTDGSPTVTIAYAGGTLQSINPAPPVEYDLSAADLQRLKASGQPVTGFYFRKLGGGNITMRPRVQAIFYK